MKLLVANWKANKNVKEAIDFAESFGAASEQTSASVILCAPFQALFPLSELTGQFNFKVGAQNVSRFENGAYTGEVTAQMLKELVSHCIVGHSERWKYFGETSQSVAQKIDQLLKNEITPILCIGDKQQLADYEAVGAIKNNSEKIIFVYEPPGAISGGGNYHAEDPNEANSQAKNIKEKFGGGIVLYGGSVNPENIRQFVEQKELDGFLVGQASLNTEAFSSLVSASSR